MLALWIVWAVLTVAVISLAVARKVVAGKEDDFVHLSATSNQAVTQQVNVAQRLEWFDHWGKTLTVVDVGLGTVLVVLMMFQAWHESMQVVK